MESTILAPKELIEKEEKSVSLPGEVWKDAATSFGMYRISSRGRFMSLKYGRCTMLKTSLVSNGYTRVTISDKGVLRYAYTHRLVLETFVGLDFDKTVCNHKNGIKSDNRLENLEWVTHRENAIHAFKMHRPRTKNTHRWSKITDDQAMEIFNSKEDSLALSKKYGVQRSYILRIKNKKDRAAIHDDMPAPRGIYALCPISREREWELVG